MSQKLYILILAIVIVVLIIAGVVIGMRLSNGNATGPSAYTAVYLSSGDVYFGKLSWFPSPRMTDVWYLQRGTDAQNKPQFGVAAFKEVFWGPTDSLKLNPKEIIFSTRLRNDSQVVKVILQGAAAATAGNPPSTPSIPAAAIPTPTTTTPTQ